MAVRDRNTIKNWFKRGDKPLASQFADWIDSFWHKGENIPMSSVENLVNEVNSRPSMNQVNVMIGTHNTDPDSHEYILDRLRQSPLFALVNSISANEHWGWAMNAILINDIWKLDKDLHKVACTREDFFVSAEAVVPVERIIFFFNEVSSFKNLPSIAGIGVVSPTQPSNDLSVQFYYTPVNSAKELFVDYDDIEVIADTQTIWRAEWNTLRDVYGAEVYPWKVRTGQTVRVMRNGRVEYIAVVKEVTDFSVWTNPDVHTYIVFYQPLEIGLTSDAFDEHNADAEAHEPIREQIDDTVSTHNSSASAHQDIRTLLANLAENSGSGDGSSSLLTIDYAMIQTDGNGNKCYDTGDYTFPAVGTWGVVHDSWNAESGSYPLKGLFRITETGTGGPSGIYSTYVNITFYEI